MSLSVYLYTDVQGIRPDEFYQKYKFAINMSNNVSALIARKAGIFDELFFPKRNGIKYANQIINQLQAGIEYIEMFPDEFNAIDEKHGYGLIKEFVGYIKEYIEACKKYPDYKIETC